MTRHSFVIAMLLAAPAVLWAQPRSAVETAKDIDAHIDRVQRREKLPVSPRADDAEFLRRVSLDVWGRIPGAEQVKSFLASSAPAKRSELVEELLAAPRYGEHFGRLWRERLANEDPVRGEIKTALAAWLAEGFNKGRGWDATVAEILTAEGTAPGVAFVWNSLDDGQPRANKLAAAAARRFLGNQLQCAECHDHPYANWKQDDFWGLAVFFSRTALVEKKDEKGKPRNHVVEKKEGPPKTRFGPPPLKMPAAGSIILPDDAGRGAGKKVSARLFQTAAAESIANEAAFRPKLAAWIISRDNPYFAKAAVNRLWAHFFGRGLVNPVDDLHDDNAATHPELLELLAKEFVASGYDQKHMIRAITASAAYQRSHRPVVGNEKDDKFYSRALVRSLDAEMTVDSLQVALGYDQFPRRAKLGAKTVPLPDRRKLIDLMTTRDVDGDATQFTGGIPQVLLLLNGTVTNVTPPTVERALKAKNHPEAIVDSLFLASLSRRPTDEERSALTEYFSRRKDPAQGAAGVLWILINSAEFVMVP